MWVQINSTYLNSQHSKVKLKLLCSKIGKICGCKTSKNSKGAAPMANVSHVFCKNKPKCQGS